MFFFIALSLLSMLILPNSLFFVFILLCNVLSILYHLVSSSSLSVLTMLMLVIVYLGAIIILIGYICAVCPNMNLSSSFSFSPILLTSFLIFLLFSYSSDPRLLNSSGLTYITEFFYSGDGLIILIILILMLFITLLIVTSQYLTPSGPFRSLN